jgi:hypothetical protein
MGILFLSGPPFTATELLGGSPGLPMGGIWTVLFSPFTPAGPDRVFLGRGERDLELPDELFDDRLEYEEYDEERDREE